MTTPDVEHELAATVERLKLEGNTFFGEKNYEAACRKYTEAIEKDKANAILYSNRAAARLAQKQYLDAAWDCQTAIGLDPTYARAWGRLATAAHALQSWDHCIKAWTQALHSLPSEGSSMTDSEKSMKTQFEEGLKKALDAKKAGKSGEPYYVINQETASRGLPWDRAKAAIAARSVDRNSSAYVIQEAYDEFKEGLDSMNASRIQQTPAGQMFFGRTDVLVSLSNAILCDERCFHLRDHNWPNKLNQQSMFENTALKGWANGGGPAFVKEEAKGRLQRQGWNAVRPAISVTVRIWVFNAYFRSELAGHKEAAHELFTQAVDILEWGRKEWPDIAKDDRGAVFEKSFIRGVKRLQLVNMHKALAGGMKTTLFTVDDLVALAEDLIKDVDTDPIPSEYLDANPGHFSAFWAYPKASALSILGWYYLYKGSQARRDSPTQVSHYRRAAEYYEKAGETYAPDDENRAYFLRMALDCLSNAKAPLKELLPLCKRVRHAIPKAREIWQVSTVASTLTTFEKDVVEFEMKYMQELAERKATMETIAKINPVLPPKLEAGANPMSI